MSARIAIVTAMATLCWGTTVTQAAYLRDVPQVLRQPNGAVVECLASGDEYFNFWHDRAGYVIVRDPANGLLVYAAKTAGEIGPTPYVVNTVDPASVKLVPGIRPDRESLRRRGDIFMQPALRALAAVQGAPSLSAINNVVIYIRFSDEGEFTESTARYESIFNTTTAGANSLHNYFQEVSYGAVTVTGTIVPAAGGAIVSYQDDQPRSYYEPYDATTNPGGYADDQRAQREHILLRKAVEWAAAQVPASLTVDANGDGLVDNVCFIVRGEASGWSSLIWPHRWAMSARHAEVAYIRGKRVEDYIFLTETRSYTGIFAHELGHSLGAPDLYHYSGCSSAPDLTPVGRWDVMENDLDPPQHSTAYVKSHYFGYLDAIPEITQSGTYTLNPITSATNNAYRIASPNAADEYFVVEYRRRIGTFESSLPMSGLLVYRIATHAGTGNGCGPPDEIYVYRPGGTMTGDGNLDAAPLSADVGRTAINDSTDPSALLSDGRPGGLSVSQVSSPGATISFTVTLAAGCEQAPAAFSLTSPANGAGLPAGTTAVTLSWNAATGADEYDVYTGASADPPLVGSTAATSYTVLVGQGTTYWRVAARNKCGATPAPVFDPWSFVVGGTSGEVAVISDDFEGAFPGTRDVRAANATAWGKSTYRANGGTASAWCAGGGTAPQPAGGPYVSDMNTWIILGPFSLADATAARLEFDLWASTESGYDKVGWQVSTQRDTGYTGSEHSGATGGWVHKTMDLANANGPSLIGQAQVFVAFSFVSDSNTQLEGAYIDNVVITKQVGIACTAPEIGTQPASVTIASGQTAPLSLAATGTAPLGYQWYRGNSGATGDPIAGATAASYTTAALAVTTTFWCRVANACGHDDSVAATVTIAPPERPFLYIVPSIAHLPGQAGTAWRTDVSAVNPADQPASLTLSYYSASDGMTASVDRTLAPDATAIWSDVLTSVFGLAPAGKNKGVLHLASSVPLAVASRTYNQAAAGTYGQYYPALTAASSVTPGKTGIIPHLSANAAFRVHIGIANLGASGSCTVAVRLFGADGVQAGSTVTITAAAGRYTQKDNIFTAAGAGNRDVAYATVEVQTPGGMAWAYASVVDNVTGDPTTIPVLVP